MQVSNPIIRALIIDDEPIARELLEWMLRQDPDVKILGSCGDGRSAVTTIRQMRPDLVFLDVQMPDVDGFALLRNLKPEEIPYLIFVTAYESYAVRAFDVQAIDYLLKPFNQRRFQKALSRAKERILGKQWSLYRDDARLSSGGRYVDRLQVKSNGRIYYLPVDEIFWIKAADQYAEIHCGAGSYLVRLTMSWLERYLDPERFVRVHRSIIVSVSQVREAALNRDEGPYLELQNGKKLKVSRRRLSAFRRLTHIPHKPS